MVPGPIPANLKKPVNPKFDAFAQVNATASQGSYQPDTWGTWDLLAVIPKLQLASTPVATTTGYNYKYDDKDVVLGFSYWYYVAAYKEGTYTGPDGETTNRIETHSTNRNGATGLWALTFPFAAQNANFGKLASNDAAQSAQGLKNIGAAVVLNSALAVDVNQVPIMFRLEQNYPNPFNPSTRIAFAIPKASKVQLRILDVLGRDIALLFDGQKPAGAYELQWDAGSLPSGIYFYRLQSGEYVETRKMILLK